VDISSPEKIKNSLDRRGFLKLASVGTGSFLVGNSLLGEWIENLNPDIPMLVDAISDYEIAWQARPWVWVNLAIASKFIDNTVIHPKEEVSLIKLLQFDNMANVPRINMDPRLGYVAAQMSNPLKLDGWGYGLCLASTAIFRACLESPIHITESGTHYDVYPDYFKDLPTGTDAAIFYPEPGDTIPQTDLKLLNPTDRDLKLRFQLFDAGGNELLIPDSSLSEVWYKATYLDQLVRILRSNIKESTNCELPRQFLPEEAFGNKKIIVRAGVVGAKPEYNVSLGPVKHGDSTIVDGVMQYAFNRSLTIKDVSGEERVFYENFVSQYH